MARFFGLLKKKAGSLSKKMDQYQEALTFAESGQQEPAKRLFQEEAAEERHGKLLVVGREGTFSREVIDYALEMAQRMSYEILALNTAPLSCETFNIFSSSQKKLCQDFRTLSQENVKEFRQEAEKLGISFEHVVKFKEREQALQEINGEFKDIDFVVSDTEEENVIRAEEGERPTQPIYVYSMI
ncbi:MAG: hypothetical protein JRJ71_10015 [Deltaproteobacteria bacterium]|nr:hypothetical protein [Deltaproteobacteria bacterium]